MVLPKFFGTSKSPSKENRPATPRRTRSEFSPEHSPSSYLRRKQSTSPYKPPVKRAGKSFSKSREQHDLDTHPLNLPPEQLRRLMAAASDPLPTGGDHVPSSPPPEAPGAFPATNGADHNTSDDDTAPPPPPHGTSSPSSSPSTTKQNDADIEAEAESFKAAGNKFFKAKQYDKAIAEYTKGI